MQFLFLRSEDRKYWYMSNTPLTNVSAYTMYNICFNRYRGSGESRTHYAKERQTKIAYSNIHFLDGILVSFNHTYARCDFLWY